MNKKITIKIGTRKSKLALIQTDIIINTLSQYNEQFELPINYQIIPMQTSGDNSKGIPLHNIGGKALFTKEIDQAVLDKKIDIAVHSMKDCETYLAQGLNIVSITPRGDYHEVLINKDYCSLQTLPKNAVVGTCSPRRAAQLLNIRQDLQIVNLRGNVPTRFAKAMSGAIDASLLAIAGLKRLKIDYQNNFILDENIITPAAGQGFIGIVYHQENSYIQQILKAIKVPKDFACLQLERKFLQTINGNCYSPIGALALEQANHIQFTGCVASLNGKHLWREKIKCAQSVAQQEIIKLGKEMQFWLNKHC